VNAEWPIRSDARRARIRVTPAAVMALAGHFNIAAAASAPHPALDRAWGFDF